MWNCVSPFKPPAECVFPSNCSPLVCHLPSDSSLSIWVLFWDRQLLSRFPMPRADKQALGWECVFLWSQHCIFTLFIYFKACVCVCVWIEVVVVDISVVLNAVIVYDLWIVKGCVYTLRSRTHTLTHQWQQAVIHTVQHPFISHTPISQCKNVKFYFPFIPPHPHTTSSHPFPFPPASPPGWWTRWLRQTWVNIYSGCALRLHLLLSQVHLRGLRKTTCV